MGVTAENVAGKWASPARTRTPWPCRATSAPPRRRPRYFKEQILPIEAQVAQGHRHLRHRRAHPGRRRHGGHGQAAPGVRQERFGDRRERRRDQRRRRRGDAGDAETAERKGWTDGPAAVAYAAGVEPKYMSASARYRRSMVLEANLKVDDIDVFEVNEAFAAQALAVVRDLSLPEDRTNPNGSGVSLGTRSAPPAASSPSRPLQCKRTGGRRAWSRCVSAAAGRRRHLRARRLRRQGRRRGCGQPGVASSPSGVASPTGGPGAGGCGWRPPTSRGHYVPAPTSRGCAAGRRRWGVAVAAHGPGLAALAAVGLGPADPVLHQEPWCSVASASQASGSGGTSSLVQWRGLGAEQG